MLRKSRVAAFLGSAFAGTAFAAQPNIIYIFTDQQTANAMSCAGNPYLKTPNIDRLAAEGVRFVNAYCASPLSTPSRASMFTGYAPGQIGQLKNGTPLADSIPANTLGNVLSQGGYECAYAGKWHVPESDIPESGLGFRKLYGHDDRGLAETCDVFLSQKHGKPFFLVAAFDNPHNICEYARGQGLPFCPFIPETKLSDCPPLPANFNRNPYDADVLEYEKQLNYSLYPTLRYSPDDWRRYRNAYFRLVEHIDAEVGKILSSVDKNKLWNNTIIIFSSDHGDGNAAHQWNQKSALYEEVSNIPFIIRLPKAKNKGTVCEYLVNNGVDLMPSLCEIAGLEIPKHCKGESWLKVAENPLKILARECVVMETLFDRSTTKGWAVRTPDYKYILYDKGNNREQLYDMKKDRGEMVNLAVMSQYETLVKKHRELLNNWIKANHIRVSSHILRFPE